MGAATQAAGGEVLEAARRAAAHVFVADLDAPALAPGDRHHLTRVLRIGAGEQVGATDGRGGWRPCHLEQGGTLQAIGEVVRLPQPAPLLTVGVAVVKGERTEWAVQKLTELGIDRIVPLHCERSVVRWDGERGLRHVARLREVARQAAMQSRRVWWPAVSEVATVAELVAEATRTCGPPAGPGGGCAGMEGGAPAEAIGVPAGTGGVALAEPGGAPPTLAWPTVLVGPEGGWGPSELASGVATVNLGPGVLRSESAAVAAASLLAALRAGLVAPVG